MTSWRMDEAYHYPPELLQLLTDAIPRLNRSKNDTVLFFRGAGVPQELLVPVTRRLREQPEQTSKYWIARTLLVGLNEGGDALLRARREVVKRVAEFEDFSRCWANDQMEARGLVAEVRRVVNVKDSFTRMSAERRREEEQRGAARRAEADLHAAEAAARERATAALFALFGEPDAHRRGKALEAALNALFALDGMLVREAFTLRGRAGNGVIEQIDGVVQVDGHLYLVEMKWWNAALGPGDVAQHLVRIYNRADVRGLFISYTDFTPAALESCRDALQQRVVMLATLQEVVAVLQSGGSLAAMVRAKAAAAVVDRQPYAPYVSPPAGGG